uniref:Uncharacterized protein n=1 Tax=Meloidogyne enterolobii TaxID=390850 RepID=A0A6V7WE49_MELEN|nr:unnamed protein product [Meloidogyne enterolobii]
MRGESLSTRIFAMYFCWTNIDLLFSFKRVNWQANSTYTHFYVERFSRG